MNFFKIRPLAFIFFAASLMPANAAIQMETDDGLPIEVEFIGTERDEVTMQNTASKREMKFNLKKLPPPVKEQVETIIKERRNAIRTVSFRVTVEDNTSSTPITLKQENFLSPAEEKSVSENPKTLPARSRTIRIDGAGDSKWGVDLPLDVTIYWFAQMPGDSTWRIYGTQPVKFNLTSTRADFIARPPSFARSAFRGYAAIAVNPVNGLIVWRNASATAFMQAAEEKLRLSK